MDGARKFHVYSEYIFHNAVDVAKLSSKLIKFISSWNIKIFAFHLDVSVCVRAHTYAHTHTHLICNKTDLISLPTQNGDYFNEINSMGYAFA